MKKLLILILIALVLTLTIFTVVKGFSIGGLTILGIQDIQSKNAELEDKVTQATRLASSEFPSKVSEVNTSMKKMKDEKQEYEDMVAVSSAEDVETASKLAKYAIDYLWAKVGTHATSEGVVIKMDITNGSGAEKSYNLNFTVNGAYVNISEFIRDIEDDTTLGFKIEEFAMKAGGSTSDLQATFVCKDIPIEGISSVTPANTDNTNNTSNNANTANNTSTNSTNNTNNNTNTTNNTTNSTNTSD